MDEFGDGFVLLQLGGDEVDLAPLRASASERRLQLRVLRYSEPELRELYGANLALIRPDLHVAWRGDEPPTNPTALWDVVRGAGAAVAV